jgi:hypothetical protein
MLNLEFKCRWVSSTTNLTIWAKHSLLGAANFAPIIVVQPTASGGTGSVRRKKLQSVFVRDEREGIHQDKCQRDVCYTYTPNHNVRHMLLYNFAWLKVAF